MPAARSSAAGASKTGTEEIVSRYVSIEISPEPWRFRSPVPPAFWPIPRYTEAAAGLWAAVTGEGLQSRRLTIGGKNPNRPGDPNEKVHPSVNSRGCTCLHACGALCTAKQLSRARAVAANPDRAARSRVGIRDQGRRSRPESDYGEPPARCRPACREHHDRGYSWL